MWWVWIALSLLVVLIGASVACYNKDWFLDTFSDRGSSLEPKYPCVCVFDIDGTLTCGDPDPMVDACVKKGCKLTINTARPVKWMGGIKSSAFFDPKLFDVAEDYYYNPKSYFESRKVPETKVNILDAIQRKYDLSRERVFFFDDHAENVRSAKRAGYPTFIAGNGPHCGYSEKDHSAFSQILDKIIL